jgi:integrase
MSARRTKRTDGRYSVTARIESPDGTIRRTYFYGRTQAEAKAKADAARERVGRGEPVRDATRTVSDWLAEWRTTFLRASDRAESTKELYAGLTERHVEPLIGHLALGQVKPSDITRVLLHLERLGRAASTRRNAYAALRSAFDDAVTELLTCSRFSGRLRCGDHAAISAAV